LQRLPAIATLTRGMPEEARVKHPDA